MFVKNITNLIFENHRADTLEEREERKRKGRRWSELKPDPRIKEKTATNEGEELILLHEDNIPYNIIVHKTHNAFRREGVMKKQNKYKKEKVETLFGDFVFTKPKGQPSWADITNPLTPKSSPEASKKTSL